MAPYQFIHKQSCLFVPDDHQGLHETSTQPFPVKYALTYSPEVNNDSLVGLSNFTSDFPCHHHSKTSSLGTIFTQNQRMKLLHKGCQNFSDRHQVTLSQLNNIFVDDRNKMLFCAIPKVACTNFKRVLVHLSNPRNVSLKETHKLKVHDAEVLKAYGINRLSDYTLEEVNQRLSSYFKFMFTRHPLVRLYSAYNDKFAKHNKYTQYFHHKYGRNIIR